MFDDQFIDGNYNFAVENIETLAELVKRIPTECSDGSGSNLVSKQWTELFRSKKDRDQRQDQIFTFCDSELNVVSVVDDSNICPTQLFSYCDDPTDSQQLECERSSQNFDNTPPIETINKILEWNGADEAIPASLLESFVKISTKSLSELDLTLLTGITDDRILLLCVSITNIVQELSIIWCLTFVKCFMLKTIMSMQNVPSRDFMIGLANFSKRYPRSIIEGLMIPVFINENQCTIIQIDIIRQLFYDSLSSEHKVMFLKEALEHCFLWNESVIIFLNSCVETKAEIICEEILNNLITRISDCSDNLNNSLTFSKFLVAVIQKMNCRLKTLHVTLLTIVANRNKTCLKKVLLAKLQQIN